MVTTQAIVSSSFILQEKNSKKTIALLKEKNMIQGKEIILLKEMNKTISGPQMKVPTKGVISTLKKKDPQSLIDIRAAMNKVIFPYIKFIPKERLMSIAPKSIGATVCKYLGISDKDLLTFWSTRYLIAYAEFSHHKTRVSRCVKEAFQTSMLFHFLIVWTSIVANHFVFFFDKQILSNSTQMPWVSMI